MADQVIHTARNKTDGNESLSTATTISFGESAVAYSSLYLMAIFCIYVGSYRSLRYVNKHVTEKKKIESSITIKEARMFPLTASAVLFSLYIFFKHGDSVMEGVREQGIINYVKHLAKIGIAGLSGLMGAASTVDNAVGNVTNSTPVTAVKEAVTAIVNGTMNVTSPAVFTISQCIPSLSKQNIMYGLLILLCWEGCVAFSQLMKPILSKLFVSLPLGADRKLRTNPPYRLKMTREKEAGRGEEAEIFNWEFDFHDIASLVCCLPVMALHLWKRHWITNNILGISFCLFGIEQLHLSSFKGGCLLLSGLFVYDVFWVFATDVMTTVATGIQAPILLMFPQDLFQNGLTASKHAMLGLGDIVIPGLFLALLLRFDSAPATAAGDSAQKNQQQREFNTNKTRRRYFPLTMFAYAAGLVATIGIMHWFKAAQPALLYLVPACVGCPLLLASIKGDLSAIYNYSEDHLVKKDDKPKNKSE